LKSYNTFNVEASAAVIAFIENVDDIFEAKKQFQSLHKHFVLGGGSNTLFINNYEGLILKNEMKGIKITNSNQEYTWVECSGGEEWQHLVDFTILNDLVGIEYLSLIPGTVGASPIQNIGAYGTELKDCLDFIDTVEIATGEHRRFYNKDCQFGYRDSVFKHELKGKYFITAVTIKLSGNNNYNTEYADIKRKLQEIEVTELSGKLISDIVSEIRRTKLPDPSVLGNCGSFFKNCVIGIASFDKLKVHFPDIPGYPDCNGMVKIPAGWLIEKAGWKGRRVGDVGVYEKHALILVNYGTATGKDIYDLSENIARDVEDKFGIHLEKESNIV
jgi:UDP-N-acetylmuramate dehydrogenase